MDEFMGGTFPMGGRGGQSGDATTPDKYDLVLSTKAMADIFVAARLFTSHLWPY